MAVEKVLQNLHINPHRMEPVILVVVVEEEEHHQEQVVPVSSSSLTHPN